MTSITNAKYYSVYHNLNICDELKEFKLNNNIQLYSQNKQQKYSCYSLKEAYNRLSLITNNLSHILATNKIIYMLYTNDMILCDDIKTLSITLYINIVNSDPNDNLFNILNNLFKFKSKNNKMFHYEYQLDLELINIFINFNDISDVNNNQILINPNIIFKNGHFFTTYDILFLLSNDYLYLNFENDSLLHLLKYKYDFAIKSQNALCTNSKYSTSDLICIKGKIIDFDAYIQEKTLNSFTMSSIKYIIMFNHVELMKHIIKCPFISLQPIEKSNLLTLAYTYKNIHIATILLNNKFTLDKYLLHEIIKDCNQPFFDLICGYKDAHVNIYTHDLYENSILNIIIDNYAKNKLEYKNILLKLIQIINTNNKNYYKTITQKNIFIHALELVLKTSDLSLLEILYNKIGIKDLLDENNITIVDKIYTIKNTLKHIMKIYSHIKKTIHLSHSSNNKYNLTQKIIYVLNKFLVNIKNHKQQTNTFDNLILNIGYDDYANFQKIQTLQTLQTLQTNLNMAETIMQIFSSGNDFFINEIFIQDNALLFDKLLAYTVENNAYEIMFSNNILKLIYAHNANICYDVFVKYFQNILPFEILKIVFDMYDPIELLITSDNINWIVKLFPNDTNDTNDTNDIHILFLNNYFIENNLKKYVDLSVKYVSPLALYYFLYMYKTNKSVDIKINCDVFLLHKLISNEIAITDQNKLMDCLLILIKTDKNFNIGMLNSINELGESLLHICAKYSHHIIMQILLENKVDGSHLTKNNMSYIHYIAKYCHESVLTTSTEQMLKLAIIYNYPLINKPDNDYIYPIMLVSNYKLLVAFLYAIYDIKSNSTSENHFYYLSKYSKTYFDIYNNNIYHYLCKNIDIVTNIADNISISHIPNMFGITPKDIYIKSIIDMTNIKKQYTDTTFDIFNVSQNSTEQLSGPNNEKKILSQNHIQKICDFY